MKKASMGTDRMTTVVGRNIHFLRKKHGFTQTELGEMVGKSRYAILTYEKGIADPSIITLIRLGKLFHVSIDELVSKRIYDKSNLKQTNMSQEIKNPKTITEIVAGASYAVPTYKVTNEGLVDGDGITIVFCKGNKEDESALRQEGVFTETLLQTVKQYLESVNVGALANQEDSMAITKIDEALMWINKRAEDRKTRGVQGTYKK